MNPFWCRPERVQDNKQFFLQVRYILVPCTRHGKRGEGCMQGFACMRHAWIFMRAMNGLYDCMAGMLGLDDCMACMACMLGFAWLHGMACLDLHGCMDAWSCMVAWLHV